MEESEETLGASIAQEGQVGLGVDIVEIARMKKILARTPSFAKRVYSEDEQKYCNGKATPEIHFATRFAAKEAVLKALGTGFSEGIGVRDIEVRRNSKGKPYVLLTGRAKEVARELGVIEIPISLSYTHTDAVACAMAITEESVKVAEERVDPMEELAKQFKEARKMLDDIDKPIAVEQQEPDGAYNSSTGDEVHTASSAKDVASPETSDAVNATIASESFVPTKEPTDETL